MIGAINWIPKVVFFCDGKRGSINLRNGVKNFFPFFLLLQRDELGVLNLVVKSTPSLRRLVPRQPSQAGKLQEVRNYCGFWVGYLWSVFAGRPKQCHLPLVGVLFFSSFVFVGRNL